MKTIKFYCVCPPNKENSSKSARETPADKTLNKPRPIGLFSVFFACV